MLPSLSLPLALLALLPLALVELAKAARWRVLFGTDRPPYARCLRALVAGQLTNQLAPVRAGEAVRLGLLRAEGSALATGAASMVGAKAIDAACLAGIALAVLGTTAAERVAWGLAGAGMVLAGMALVAARGTVIRRCLQRYAWTRRLGLARLVDVAESVRTAEVRWIVLVTTAIVWGAGLAANAVVLAAVGIAPSFDLAARVLVAGYVAGQIPAPPARLGVFEGAIALALTSGGVALPEALAASVVLRVCQLVELGALLAVGAALGRRPVRRSAPTVITASAVEYPTS